MDGGEADLAGGGGEAWPAVGGAAQVGDGDGPAGVEAFRAGALVGLQLEEFEQPGLFGGGGHHLQCAALVGE